MVSYFTVIDCSGWWSWQRWNCPSLQFYQTLQ